MSMKYGERGAVLIETALTLMIGLTFLFGVFSIGALGYAQLAADGMALDRGIAVGGHADYESGSQSTFAAEYAGLMQGVFSSSSAASTPTETSGPDPWTFSWGGPGQPNPYVNTKCISCQYTTVVGGASFIRLGQLSTQYSVQNSLGGFFPALGFNFAAVGASAEPIPVAVGPQFDLAQVDQNAPATYANAWDKNHDWLEQPTVNLPPTFMGIFIDYVCADDYEFPQGPDCLNGHGRLESYGLAEYLDNDNYGTPPGITGGTTFNAMLTHQQCYAKLLSGPNAFPAQIPPLSTTPNGAAGYYTPATGPSWQATAQTLPREFLTSAPGYNPILHVMYTVWDVPKPADSGNVPAPNPANRANPLGGGC